MAIMLVPNVLAKRTKLLGHPLRMQILRILIARRQQVCCVNVLIGLLETEMGSVISQPNVSHCLKDLLQIGLVEKRDTGYIALPGALSGLLGELRNYTGITQENGVEYEERPGEN